MITQTFEFYNSTNVIEKDANIYFHPIFDPKAGMDTRLDHMFYNEFVRVAKRVVVPTDNKPLSNWYPEDRVFSGLGNVETYRSPRNGINYVVLKIVDDETNDIKYKGYFLTDVKQTGKNTVRLTLDPDHFSNYFFWENTETLDPGENEVSPVEESLVRTNIERQHYDRYTKNSNGTYVAIMDEKFCNNSEKFNYKILRRVDKFPLVDSYGSQVEWSKGIRERIASKNWNELSLNEKTSIIYSCVSFVNIVSKELITCPKLFRDAVGADDPSAPITGCYIKYQKVKNISQSFQSFDIPIIDIPKDFKKFENEILKANRLEIYYTQYVYNGVSRTENTILEIPTIDSINSYIHNKGFSNYIISMSINKYSNMRFTFNGIRENTDHIYLKMKLSGNEILSSGVGRGTFSNFIGVTDMPTVGCDRYELTTFLPDPSYIGKGINADNPLSVTMPKDLNLITGCIRAEVIRESAGENPISYLLTIPNFGHIPCFMCNKFRDMKISISREKIKGTDLSTLEEPILSYYPYNYKSVSYLGLAELELKDVYFMNNSDISNVNIDLITSVNDFLRVSLIPVYGNYDDPHTQYFNNALTFNITSSFPIDNDSYLSYFYQNKAQMNNQYAVNDVGLKQSLLSGGIKSLTNIGGSAITRGNAFAVANAIGSVGDLIASGVNYNFEKEKIEKTQEAILTDVGVKPDNIKNLGTDVYYDLMLSQNILYVNEYKIDEISANNIRDYLNRYGYEVNRYDTLDCLSRKYWNYVKLISFDFTSYISLEEEKNIRNILTSGVTLIHDPEGYKYNYKNYERRI